MKYDILKKIVIRFFPVLVVLTGSYLLTGYDAYSVKWFVGVTMVMIGAVLLAKDNLMNSKQ